jgi:hypothetical protein
VAIRLSKLHYFWKSSLNTLWCNNLEACFQVHFILVPGLMVLMTTWVPHKATWSRWRRDLWGQQGSLARAVHDRHPGKKAKIQPNSIHKCCLPDAGLLGHWFNSWFFCFVLFLFFETSFFASQAGLKELHFMPSVNTIQSDQYYRFFARCRWLIAVIPATQRGRDQEDWGPEPAWGNSSWEPI